MNSAPAKTRWDIVWLAVGAGVFCAFQVGKMPAAIPFLRADLSMSLVTAGIAVSMFNLIACAIGLIIGALSDMAGARRVILAGLIVSAIASLAGSQVTSDIGLLIARAVEGLGAIIVFIAAPIIIVRAIRITDMRQAFGAWGSYMPMGSGLMVTLSPFLIGPLGWRGMWLVCGGLLLIYAGVFFRGTRAVADPPSAPAAERLPTIFHDMKQVLRARGPWLLGLCFASYTGNYLAVTTFLPTYFVERLAYSQTLAALLTAVVIFGNVVGNLAGGRLLARGVPRWQLLTIASATMAACSFGIFSDDLPDWLPFVMACLFSTVGGILPVSILAGAPVHAPTPRQVGTTNGLIVQLGNLGMVVAPAILAAIVSQSGWSMGPVLIVISATVGILLALAIRHLEKAQ